MTKRKESLAALYEQAGITKLLSPPGSNPKVAKNGKVGVMTWVLHLASGDMSGHEVCPKRSPGCSAACLMYAGNPAYTKNKTQARIKKTKLFFSDRDLFMNILALEIAAAIKKAKAANMEPAFRLNGTSDIVWEKKSFGLYLWVARKLGATIPTKPRGVTIVDLFKDASFYDYTKIPGRIPPVHYHLTFSESEINAKDVASEMRRGINIASVFPAKAMPKMHLGRNVIDGDEHDYRPADPAGIIVGLKIKGSKGRADKTGFTHAA